MVADQLPPVLVITHEASRSGAPKVALQLAQAHLDAGYRTILLWRWSGPALEQFSRQMTTLAEPWRRTRAILRRYPPTKQLAIHLENAAAMRALRRIRPSIVWANSTLSAPYARAAARLGIPFVLYSHEPYELARSALSRLGPSGCREVLGPWGTLLGCSTATAEDLSRAFSAVINLAEDGGIIAIPTVDSLPSPVDIDSLRASAPALRIGGADTTTLPDRFVLGCGVANRTKGVDIFAAAAEADAAMRPESGLRWVWLGRLPEGFDADQRGFERVLFLGEVANPAPILRRADALVMASRVDPFPLVVLEAMALDVPVVSSDLPGTREQLGDTALFFEVEDHDGLVAAVHQLSQNPSISAALASRAHERCRERWDIASFSASALDITARAVGAPNPANGQDAPSSAALESARPPTSVRFARPALAQQVKLIAHGVDQSVRLTRAVARRPAAADPEITVLAYHRVGPGPISQMRLDVDLFRRQLDHLAEHAEVISLEMALGILGTPAGRPATAEHLSGQGSTRRPLVVLTFDDGTADFADTVVPELAARSLTATVYVATQFVETHTAWDDGARPVSWNGLGDCLSTGLVEIGGHTHSHLLLDRCSPQAATADLDRADRLIRDRLDVTVRSFAYPKAVMANVENARLVADRYSSAAVAGTRPNHAGRTDPQRLFRSPIQRGDAWEFFVHKVNGGMRFEDDLRRVANRVRYRGRST
jgi:glycosyltransferase involved in cell wall biosynthesis/peptidoglycan/xylan/chitin deacetylase (PgdA/CDA1 family)